MVNLILVDIHVLNGDYIGYVTVSAKIPRKLKELMDKYGTKPWPIIRRRWKEVRRRILEEAESLVY